MFWRRVFLSILERKTGTSLGTGHVLRRVTVMAGVQAAAALGDDEHGHYEDDDYSSALLDEHFRLEKEYESN